MYDDLKFIFAVVAGLICAVGCVTGIVYFARAVSMLF